MTGAPIVFDLRRLTQKLLDWLAGFATHEKHLHAAAVFHKVFFAWLFLHTALLLPYHAEIWAPEAFVQRYPFEPASWLEWVLTLSRHPALEAYYLVFILGQLGALTLGFFGVWPRLMTLVAYLLTMNINSLAGVILDGGNNLAQLVLFFLIFVNTSGKAIALPRWPALRGGLVAVANLAFTMIMVQIALVYFCAGIYKLNGHLWSNGMALYYILQADTYSHPVLHDLIIEWPWLSLIGSYFTVGFQMVFPYLIWSKKTRPWVIAAGVMLHLGISFGMGLFTFGLVMIAMYFAYCTEVTAMSLLRIGGRQPLHIVRYPAAGGRLLTWLRRLDIRRVLVDRRQSGEQGEDTSISVWDPERERSYNGAEALRELLVRPFLAAPLAPLVYASWYLGGLDRLQRRLQGQPQPEVTSQPS